MGSLLHRYYCEIPIVLKSLKVNISCCFSLINPKFKTEDNIIKGCQSKVWLHADLENEKVVFSADSDAIITKGIVAILNMDYWGREGGGLV